MYDVRIVYKDLSTYDVGLDDENLEDFMLSISQNKPYYDKLKNLSFCFPADSVRCAYAIKKLTQPQEEPCQKNHLSEAESAFLS